MTAQLDVGLAPVVHENLPAHIQERLPGAFAHAAQQSQRINESMAQRKAEFDVRLRVCLNPTAPRTRRLALLRSLAQDIGQLAYPHSACRRGCAHCCHIPVTLSALEATLIGKAIGRAPAQLGPAVTPGSQRAFGDEHPCPFLRQGACSIYEHRPLGCRVHFNLDVDEMLCRLIAPATVPVPYLDLTPLQAAYVQVCGEHPLADIRDFFPV